MTDSKIAQARQARYAAKMARAAAVVPEGPYCYAHTGQTHLQTRIRGADGQWVDVATPFPIPTLRACPFLKIRGDWPEGHNGYCRLTKMGDHASFPGKQDGLLWDSIKSCGVNEGEDDLDDHPL